VYLQIQVIFGVMFISLRIPEENLECRKGSQNNDQNDVPLCWGWI